MTTPRPLTPFLLLALLALAGLAGYCGYQALTAAALTRALADRHSALAAARHYTAEVTRARAAGRTLATHIPRRPPAWSWSDQFPLIGPRVATLVEGAGARIDTLQLAPPLARQGVTRFPLRLTLHPSLVSLTHLLQRLRLADPLLAVDQLAIHTPPHPAAPLTVELTLSSYARVADTNTEAKR